MKTIKTVADIIKKNLHEARKYIEMAIEYKEEAPALSEWARKMAKAHLDFNVEGHAAAKRMIDEYKAKGEHSDLTPGMMALYNFIHAGLVREEAELSAMLQTLK